MQISTTVYSQLVIYTAEWTVVKGCSQLSIFTFKLSVSQISQNVELVLTNDY